MKRTLNGIEYLIPSLENAVESLRPGAKWNFRDRAFYAWKDPAGTEPPTWDEVQEEMTRLLEIYNFYEYERKRADGYVDVLRQLDMIFHDIKNGNLENGSWIKHIEEIKNKYPKPEGPAPEL